MPRLALGVSDPDALAHLMTRVTCAGGFTQIRKVLSHAREEAGKKPVNALVYVGDCMEEDVDELCGRAGELALLGVPVFLFQEGSDAKAETDLPRDRPPHQGRLLPVRCGLRRSVEGSAGGRCGLRRGRAQGTGRAGGRVPRLLLEQMK